MHFSSFFLVFQRRISLKRNYLASMKIYCQKLPQKGCFLKEKCSFPGFFTVLGSLVLILFYFMINKREYIITACIFISRTVNIFIVIIKVLTSVHCQLVFLTQFSTGKFGSFCVLRCLLFMHSSVSQFSK